ncbi:hypothetical protein JH395_16360 (plasmid) [Lactiplantibacillus plantarum]|uniref:DUF3784 domain-containing protein n=2 Tax=Lactobacillaceae TaxID=33958 RepID=A0A1L6XAY5_9LACO|nr:MULTISPECIES: hypothetical protein [Lactobacillaceae]APT18131.1 hypothetical protein LA20533_02035 [Amylolactobacillus amylophilus DSM 20533 = JCM 1125]QQM62725.1 hypothetical protein JH395_16360 [Lactiplantibacillus plantarum]GED80502.1 hypothetical protein LAM01_09750 [Amylolactobacillus amylophilus]
MVTFIYLLLLVTLFFLFLYIYSTKKIRRREAFVIEHGNLPILYGKHYHTFKRIDKLRNVFGAIALISLTIGVYATIMDHNLSMLGLTDSIGFFAISLTFFVELLKTKLLKKKQIKYDSDLKVSNKDKKNRLISIYGTCFCCFLLAIFLIFIL